jgi:hypothetical protein
MSGFAPPLSAGVSSGLEASAKRKPVHIEQPLKMIPFVLENTCEPTLCFDLHRFLVAVESLEGDPIGTAKGVAKIRK